MPKHHKNQTKKKRAVADGALTTHGSAPKALGEPTPATVAPANRPDERAVFLECGLNYGRCFGSKSGYSRENPGCIFVANACVFTAQRKCIWRGDIDLATEDDVQGLVCAAMRLNRKLFVLREQVEDRIPPRLKAWFVSSTIVTVWRSTVTAGGDFRCLRGKFSTPLQVVSPLPSPAQKTGYDEGD